MRVNRESVVSSRKFVFGIIFLFLLLVGSGFIAQAFSFDEGYVLGDEVKIDLSNYQEYSLKIETPTKKLIRDGAGDVILFPLDEIGEYKMTLTYAESRVKKSLIVYETKEELEDVLSFGNGVVSEEEPVVNEDEKLIDNEELVVESNQTEEEVLVNESNVIVSNVTFNDLEPVYDEIRAGEEVVWKKSYVLNGSEDVSLDIPYIAEKIEVDGEEVEFYVDKTVYNRVVSVVSEESAKKELVVHEGKGRVGVRYTTPAPEKTERNLEKNKKEVVISAPDYLNYKNVSASTRLNGEIRSHDEVRVYWKEEGRYLDFDLVDKDLDGLADEVEWVVPHLSTQTFEIIVITQAEHFDSEMNYIEDIYLEVQARDGVWKTIPEGDYVRVRFEDYLNPTSDITLYAKSRDGARVEVYEKNGQEKIADFGVIGSEDYYKVYLSELTFLQDSFDLKVVEGNVDIDLIIDPWVNVTIMSESFESTTPNYFDAGGNWTRGSTDWDRSTALSQCGSASAHIDGAGTAVNYITLNAGLLDLTGAQSVNVSFWWNCDSGSDVGEYFSYDEYYSGVWHDDVYSVHMATCPIVGWNYYERMLPASAFQNDFRVRFAAQTDRTNEDIYIDCFNVVKEMMIGGAPSLSGIGINTTDGSNKPSRDLNCFATITDNENDPIDATVRWYKDGSLYSTVPYNNGYSSGTNFVATLDSSNLGDMENWKCSIQLTDGSDTSVWYNSSEILLSLFDVDYTPQTCSDYWGFDCSAGPPESGDNTFDSCGNGAGNDESVDEMYLNGTKFKPGEAVELICEFDSYESAGDEYYISYNNGTGWRQLDSGSITSPVGQTTNRTVILVTDNVVGNHTIRCSIDYNGEADGDECSTGGSWYDNDDLRFEVVSTNTPPSVPTSITCNGGSCDIEVNESVILECGGSVDSQSDPITYFIEALVGTDLIYSDNVLVQMFSQGGVSWDYSSKSCSAFWGFDCGVWPTEGGDNTFDSCDSVAGASTDEHVDNVYLNATNVQPGEIVEVTCEFDPYDTGTEEYIYFYDGSWNQIFSGSAPGGNIHNVTRTVTAPGTVGEYWVRCIADWDGENDECADQGSYHDNDDLSFNVSVSTPGSDFSDAVKEYVDISEAHASISDLSVKVEVDSYNPMTSVDDSTTLPDLRLEVYNGSEYKDVGAFGLPGYYGGAFDNNSHNFSLTISDSEVLSAWRILANQRARVVASNMDFTSISDRDEINYTGIWFNFGSESWMKVGNHLAGSNILWNTLAVTKSQYDVDLRCEAIDLTGENASDGWYAPVATLDIIHDDLLAPIITLVSPSDGITNTTSRKPAFTFFVNDNMASTASCSLWMSNGMGKVYENTLTPLGVNVTFSPTSSLSDGDYDWWVRCSDGENIGVSETRTISIFAGGNNRAFVQAESGRAYAVGVTSTNVSLTNTYNVNKTFIIADSQIAATSTSSSPANADAVFYFSNIINGQSSQLTVERSGTGGTLLGTYSLMESEYIDVCHVSHTLPNAVDVGNVDLSSCSIIPDNYQDKCFVSVRNNAKNPSTTGNCRAESYVMGKLTAKDNLLLQAHTRACGDREVYADVVCFNDNSQVTPISTGENHLSSGIDFPIGKSVNLSNSFLMYSCRSEELGLEDINVQCTFKDSSTISCRTSSDTTGGSAPQECEAYVVEFEDSMESSVVHHVPTALDVGDKTTFTTDLASPVILNETALFCAYDFIDGEGTAHYRGEYPAYFLDNDTIEFERGNTGNTDPSHDVSCEVIKFPTRKDPLLVTLLSPEDGYKENDLDNVDLTFQASVKSESNLQTCDFWHDATGTWHLNQSKAVGGRDTTVSFNLNDLNNVTFKWNVRCENIRSEIAFAKSPFNVEIKKISAANLTLLSPSISESGAPIKINVSSDTDLASCNYSVSGGNIYPMTSVNATYFTADEYYVRNGENSVNVTCESSLGRESKVSRNFNFISDAKTQVKHGAVTLADLSSEVSVPLVTNNLANAFLEFSVRSATSTPAQIQVDGVLNPNNITFKRYSTSGDVFIEWQVVESPNMFVRRGVSGYESSTSLIDLDVGVFDLSESFIIFSNRLDSTGTADNVQGFFTSNFLNSNTVRLERDSTGSSGEISWQVIEWEGANVKSGETLISGTTASATFGQAIDRGKSFLVTSKRMSSGDESLAESNVRAQLSSTGIDFSRDNSNGNSFVYWFVVESQEYNVQNGTSTISSSTATDVAISQVNSSKAFTINSYESTGTGTTFANSMFTAQVTSDTNLQFQKGTNSQTQTVAWQVIEIGIPLSDFINLDVPVNKSYNSSTLNFSVGTKLSALGCDYSLDGSSRVSMDLINSQSFKKEVSGLSEGNHTVLFYCNDSSNVEYTSEFVEFNIDLTSPSVVLNSPVDYFNSNSNVVNFFYTASDNNLVSECRVILDNEVVAVDYSVLNGSMDSVETYVKNGVFDWSVICVDSSGRETESSQRRINVTGPVNYPWTSRFYETSSSDFSGSFADIGLANDRDLIENSVNLNINPLSVSDIVVATSPYLGNNGAKILSGSSIDFSGYVEADISNVAYLTWKVYQQNSSGDYLICQAGDDSTGGVRISSATGTWVNSCSPTEDIILEKSDKLKLVMTAYNDGVGAVNLIHRWDGLKLSFVDFSGLKLIGELSSEFTYPTNDIILREGDSDNFTCEISCSVGECSNVRTTLQYYNGTNWINLHNNNANLIFGSGVEWISSGTVNQGSVSETFSMDAVLPSSNKLRCYSEYDYGNAKGKITPTIDIIKVPRANFVDPTPLHLIELAQDFIPINITVNETDLDSVILDFNGINQTLFNSSITLGYNLDREEFRGENETRVSSFAGGIDGTINGATYVPGYEGLALEFDGVDDYIQTDVSLTPILGSTSSLSFWVKTTQTGDDTMWMAPGVTGIEEAGGGNDIFIGWLDSTGRIGYTVANAAAVKSTVPINDGTWKHIIISRYANNGTSKIYINGELNQEAISYVGDVTNDFYSFGRIEDTGGTPEYFNGSFDKFVVYDRVLSDSEARELYTGERTFFVNKTGLVNDDYEIKVYAENYYGGIRDISRTISIKYGDTVDPTLTVFGITNNTYYTTEDFNFEIYLDEFGQSCEYSLDGASRNSFTKVNNTYFTETVNSVGSGEHSIEFFCRDSSNNEGSEYYRFVVDLLAPQISFGVDTPADLASRGPTDMTVDVNLVEENLKELVLNWNGTNYTVYDKSLISFIGLDNLAMFSEDGNVIADYITEAEHDVNGPVWVDRTAQDGEGSFEFVRSESDYIQINSPYNFVGKNITILTWVKTNSNVGEQKFLSLDDSFGSTILSIGHGAGSNVLSVTDLYGTNLAGVNVVDDAWHQVGFTFYEGKNVSIVFDGEVVSSFTTDVTLPSNLQFSLGMGYNGVTPSYFFEGSMSEVKIYDKILDSVELEVAKNFSFFKKSSSDYSFKINYENLSYGDYNYYSYAIDEAGQLSSTETRTVTIKDIDGAAPIVNLGFPVDSATVGSSSVNFNWTAEDNLDASMTCELNVGGEVFSGINSNNATLTNYLVSGLTDGPKIWFVRCQDSDLNWGYSENRSITIAEPPVINLEEANNSWITDNKIEYTPVDNTNLTSCSIVVNGSLFDTVGFITNNVVNSFDVTSLAEGYFSYSINCTDVYLLETVSETRNFYKDETSPTVSLVSPLNDSQVYDANVNFTFSFDDLLSPQAYCNLTVDGNVLNESVLVDRGVNTSISRIVSSGIHFWNVSCVDLGGNYDVSETFVVENYDAPQITLDTPSNNTWVNDTDVTFTYNPFDNNGIQNCSLYVDSAFNQVDNAVENGLINSFTATLTEDKHNWSVMCYNTLGLIGTTETYYLSIDAQAPTLAVHYPIGGETFDWNEITFNWTYNDNLDSNGTCEVVIDGFSEKTVGSTWGVVTETTVSRSDGTFNWKIRCSDEAGNSVESTEKTFSVAAPPVVDLVSPDDDFWTTNSSINFTYTPRDATGLTQCGFYLDNVNVLNDTEIEKNVLNSFVVNGISEANHNWSVKCIDADLNEKMSEVRTFGRDLTGPTVTLYSPEDSANIDSNVNPLPFKWGVDDNLDTILQCNLMIDGVNKKSNVWVGAGFNSTESVSGLSIGVHDWNVTCWDRADNTFTTPTRTFNYATPDFVVSAMTVNGSSFVEGETVFINSTIENTGSADSSNVVIDFYLGHPSSGSKIDSYTVDLAAGSIGYYNATLAVDIGLTELYTVVDWAGTFTEGSEANNIMNVNVSVGAWQYFYGDIETDSNYTLGSESGDVLDWSVNDVNGNIFMSDKDSLINWAALRAFGRDSTSSYVGSDYSDIDSALGMTGLVDSVSALYLSGGVPIEEQSYNVFDRNILNVPVTQSTDNNNFKTGILWDESDDSNGEYDLIEKEDLVFVTKINKDVVGKYGTYDYELRVPAKLREYSGAGSEAVFYVEVY